MALLTVAERFLRLEAHVALLQLEVNRLRGYAETTNSTHHEAIVRLAGRVTGQTTWPAPL